MTKTLYDLNVGDYVIRHYGSEPSKVLTIEKATKTQLVCSYNLKYSRKNGKRIRTGFKNDIDSIRVPTPGEVEEIEKEARHLQRLTSLRNQIKSALMSKDMTEDQLESIIGIIFSNNHVQQNKALRCAYFDISHVLLALHQCDTGSIDKNALECTLDDIRAVYVGDPDDLHHERDDLEVEDE